MHEHSWRKIKSAMDGNIKHLCESHFCVLIMPGYKARLYSKWFSIHKCFSKCIILFFFNRGRKLVATCRKLYLPDDMTVGALIGTLALAYCAAMVVMYVLFSLQKVS